MMIQENEVDELAKQKLLELEAWIVKRMDFLDDGFISHSEFRRDMVTAMVQLSVANLAFQGKWDDKEWPPCL